MAALTENYAANLVAQTLIILRGTIIDNNIKLRISKNSKRAILSSVLRIDFFFSLSTFFSQNLDFRTWVREPQDLGGIPIYLFLFYLAFCRPTEKHSYSRIKKTDRSPCKHFYLVLIGIF